MSLERDVLRKEFTQGCQKPLIPRKAAQKAPRRFAPFPDKRSASVFLKDARAVPSQRRFLTAD